MSCFFTGKASEMLKWLAKQMSIYGDCTVAEFIADAERHARAVKAIKEAEKTA